LQIVANRLIPSHWSGILIRRSAGRRARRAGRNSVRDVIAIASLVGGH